jgi:hypothetical protein
MLSTDTLPEAKSCCSSKCSFELRAEEEEENGSEGGGKKDKF